MENKKNSYWEQIEETPFAITMIKEKYVITMGRVVLSSFKERIEDCRKMIEDKDWEIVANMIIRSKEIREEYDILTKNFSETNKDVL